MSILQSLLHFYDAVVDLQFVDFYLLLLDEKNGIGQHSDKCLRGNIRLIGRSTPQDSVSFFPFRRNNNGMRDNTHIC